MTLNHFPRSHLIPILPSSNRAAALDSWRNAHFLHALVRSKYYQATTGAVTGRVSTEEIQDHR